MQKITIRLTAPHIEDNERTRTIMQKEADMLRAELLARYGTDGLIKIEVTTESVEPTTEEFKANSF